MPTCCKYPQDKKPGSPAVRLLIHGRGDYSVVRSGLRAADGRAEPTHLATFTTPRSGYRLAPGAQELRVPLTWTDGQGLTVDEDLRVPPGSIRHRGRLRRAERVDSDWKAASYVQFVRHVYPQKRSMFDVESYAYRGPAIYDGKKYRKLDVDDEDDAEVRAARSPTAGWPRCSTTSSRRAVPPEGETYDYALQQGRRPIR